MYLTFMLMNVLAIRLCVCGQHLINLITIIIIIIVIKLKDICPHVGFKQRQTFWLCS